MSKAPDPFYTRKPVPKELVPGTGVAGLSEEQAVQARERKLSQAGPGGSDLRKFSDIFAPDAMHAATARHHSGFDGDRLAPIESRTDAPPAKTTTAISTAPAPQPGATDSSEGTTVAG